MDAQPAAKETRPDGYQGMSRYAYKRFDDRYDRDVGAAKDRKYDRGWDHRDYK